jgi:hypothetical protein
MSKIKPLKIKVVIMKMKMVIKLTELIPIQSFVCFHLGRELVLAQVNLVFAIINFTPYSWTKPECNDSGNSSISITASYISLDK